MYYYSLIHFYANKCYHKSYTNKPNKHMCTIAWNKNPTLIFDLNHALQSCYSIIFCNKSLHSSTPLGQSRKMRSWAWVILKITETQIKTSDIVIINLTETRHLSTLTLFDYEKCRSNAQLLEKYLSCPLNNLHISRLRRPQYQMSMEQQVKTTCKLRDYHPWQCTHPDLTGLVCTLEG